MSTKVLCVSCQGSGKGRYAFDGPLVKCRARGCNGTGWVTLRALNHTEWA
jgi:hypothetical protein